MKIEEVASGITGGKGKKKKNMLVFLIVGGIIVLLMVLMKRMQPASSDAPTAEVYADNYDQMGEYFQNNTGMIQAQVDGQIQNALSTMSAQLDAQSISVDSMLKQSMSAIETQLEAQQAMVTSSLTQTLATLDAQNTGQLNTYFGELNGYLTERDTAAMEVITDLQKENEKLLGDVNAGIELDKQQQAAIEAATKTATEATKAAKDAEKKAKDAEKKAKDAEKAAKEKLSNPKPTTSSPVKTTPKPTQPKSTSSRPSNTVKTTYKGSSIVDALKSVGLNSSMSSRAQIAAKNGITNYTGTAAQNTLLLNRAKTGWLRV